MHTSNASVIRIRQLVFAGLLMIGIPQAAASQARSADYLKEENQFLNRLVGNWSMTGQIGGKPVNYCAVGRRLLSEAWLEFHMKDQARPSQYTASVFIAPDASAHDYVLHWLDQFGGPGARVVATGTRNGNVLQATFPYVEGVFRNAWEYHRATRSWTLVIESQKDGGAWSNFATYTIKPANRACIR